MPHRPDPGPMDPERFRRIVELKESRPAAASEPQIDPFRVPHDSTDFARELLTEAAGRRLVGGELLCLFEEASLHDLGAAAQRLRTARAQPGTASYAAAGAGPEGDPREAIDACDVLVLSDRVLQWQEPGGPSAAERVARLEDAQAAGRTVRAGMTIGHVESYLERTEHLLRIRESQDKTGGYAALVVRPFAAADLARIQDQPTRRRIEAHGYLGAADFLRTLAIARIALDNVRVIEADWRALGREAGQLALYYGADDLGCAGPETDSLPACTPDDLAGMIAGAGLRAVRRDGRYEPLD